MLYGYSTNSDNLVYINTYTGLYVFTVSILSLLTCHYVSKTLTCAGDFVIEDYS